MVVTHLFQILAFMAMEPPTSLEPAPISEEKNKVFRSMLPIQPADVVRGQYIGYRSEEGVAAESETETFIALKVLDRQLALGRVCLFSCVPASVSPRDSGIISIAFRETAEEHVSRGFRRRLAGSGSPHVRSRGCIENVPCRSTASDPGLACDSTS